ncbi:MAG: porin family protein [Elusimicrobiota bacterium]|jgi:predicted porin|nr:porin family protein [Elusimicrobiota bacterium]
MKKLVSVAIAMLLAASVGFAAGEINVKAGYDLASSISISGENGGSGLSADGVEVGAEFLMPVANMVKVGGGVSYLLARDVYKKDGYKTNVNFSYIPIYATIQVNPISTLPGIFLKGNIGYSVFSLGGDGSTGAETSGGLYYSAGAGYEFPFGLIAELAYFGVNSSLKFGDDTQDVTYGALAIRAGYKFKL